MYLGRYPRGCCTKHDAQCAWRGVLQMAAGRCDRVGFNNSPEPRLRGRGRVRTWPVGRRALRHPLANSLPAPATSRDKCTRQAGTSNVIARQAGTCAARGGGRGARCTFVGTGTYTACNTAAWQRVLGGGCTTPLSVGLTPMEELGYQKRGVAGAVGCIGSSGRRAERWRALWEAYA